MVGVWEVAPLCVQVLGSGSLELSSIVIASLSLLLSKAAVLERSETLLQPLPISRTESLTLEMLRVLLKRVRRCLPLFLALFSNCGF